MAPGVVYNAGLLDLAEAYTKQTGKKVAVTLAGMGGIVNAVTELQRRWRKRCSDVETLWCILFQYPAPDEQS